MWQTQPQPRLGLAHMMAVVLFHHVLSLGLGSHDFPIEKHTVVEYNNVLVWKLVRQHHQVPVFFFEVAERMPMCFLEVLMMIYIPGFFSHRDTSWCIDFQLGTVQMTQGRHDEAP